MKNVIICILLAVVIVLSVYSISIFVNQTKEAERLSALSSKLLELSFIDLGTKASDYEYINLYVIDEVNGSYVLQLDDELYICSYAYNKNGELYADVISVS